MDISYILTADSGTPLLVSGTLRGRSELRSLPSGFGYFCVSLVQNWHPSTYRGTLRRRSELMINLHLQLDIQFIPGAELAPLYRPEGLS